MSTSLMLADVGAAAFLAARFNNSWPDSGKDLTLHLFCNDVTPADSDTASTYTEADGGGYAEVTLTAGSWTIAEDSDGIETATYADVAFEFTGALTTNTVIYGYYVTDADSVLQWAQLLDAKYTPANSGDILTITPTFQLSHGTPA